MIRTIANRLLPSSVQRWARGRLHARRRARYPRTTVRHAYGGHELEVMLADVRGAEWYDKDVPWIPGLDVLLERPTPRIVFDIGAHQCVFALAMACAFGPETSVIAIEANSDEVEVARQNIALNRATNVRLVHGAVARKSGDLAFGLNHSVVIDRRSPERKVRAHSIDALAELYGAPSMIYLDVEGYESEALAGATATLASDCDWIVEVHSRQLMKFDSTASAVVEVFRQRGFRLLETNDARGPSWRPLDPTRLPPGVFYLAALHVQATPSSGEVDRG